MSVPPSSLSVSRKNTLRGREAISTFFEQKRNLRLPFGCVLRAAYLATPSPEHPGLDFIITVSKRIAKRAHDRNQLKRWVRAAIAQVPEFAEIEQKAKDSCLHITLLLSPTSPPSLRVNWGSVLQAVKAVATQAQNSAFRIQHSPQE
ncbi:MAG TPA: ribonuclease P protein component [Candidatus Kapabacteria bacterium]|nr:ribonuclease P protein component [Candidatus Kapabacteria bacterium]